MLIENLKYLAYKLNGKKPWSRGYIASRNKAVSDVLYSKINFDINKTPEFFGMGFDERIIEYPWAFSRIKKDAKKILDAGSVLNFDYILNHPDLSDKKIYINTLAPEKNCFWKKGISYVYEDFRSSSFADNTFDQIICLSTLEHVGCDNTVYTENKYKTETETGSFDIALQELKRVLKPRGKLLISVPYGKKVNHGWLEVFNSDGLDKMIKSFSPDSFEEWIYQYSQEKGWYLSSRESASECEYFNNKIENTNNSKPWLSAAEAVACLEFIK